MSDHAKYFEWIDSQVTDEKHQLFDASHLRDVTWDVNDPCVVGDTQLTLALPDSTDQLIAAGERMIDSGLVADGMYGDRPLTNLEMHAMLLASRLGPGALYREFEKNLTTFIQELKDYGERHCDHI